VGSVHGFFGDRHHGLGKRRDFFGEGNGAVHQLPRGVHARHQARAQRLWCASGRAGYATTKL
jgi:hypothetical protein